MKSPLKSFLDNLYSSEPSTANWEKIEDFLESMRCPITGEFILDPRLASNGLNYEKDAIEQQIASQSNNNENSTAILTYKSGEQVEIEKDQVYPNPTTHKSAIRNLNYLYNLSPEDFNNLGQDDFATQEEVKEALDTTIIKYLEGLCNPGCYTFYNDDINLRQYGFTTREKAQQALEEAKTTLGTAKAKKEINNHNFLAQKSSQQHQEEQTDNVEAKGFGATS